jgi:hypothetical protein
METTQAKSQQQNTATSEKENQQEGKTAKVIESRTAQLPSDIFLWTAVGMMVVSASLHLAKQKHAGLFVGQWVAPFLLFGIYNKLVKQHGHDRAEPE